ncbi:mannose-1-phosphate guanylyltransferase [Rhizobium sp. Root274]|uniref:nucleotidyltransferase family protein n=1 Tax=unclassified Rhizobium TaxID=2613769 RepID=UPI00071474B9|nr:MULTISPECIES: nucleotidyltransferase family protein [unclassified Rhizobium]KQW27806.1 mannose-1-phosphate guanylyltransferase [Rhizobium sp. Root1240]KRD28087.1 mannose-1-phosphate guanylyltransferase [Rhizobium sp. Root274]
MTITQAMVLAAGLGTRMRPITDTTPKPLVKIGGKAMIDYALDALREAGITTVVVNVHHHADQMERHLADVDGLDIIISDERARLMDSGGGLARGLKVLDRRVPALVMNADLFWIGEPKGKPSNLTRLGHLFDPGTMDMAMLCVEESQTTGHNGKNDFSMAADGALTRFRARDPAPFVYAGALALMPALLSDAPEEPFNLNIYFDRAIAARRLFGEPLEGHWLTVGTPDAVAPAEAMIARYRQES